MKTAVVCLNLGGPDTPDAIRPFLRNLFSDKRIIDLPRPIRQLVAWIISTTRAPKVKPLYAQMGGASPLLPNTQGQAEALQEVLNQDGKDRYRVFIAMRYWHPRADQIVQELKEHQPDEIVLLPLYPQFSTTTTESSFVEWDKMAKKHGLNIPTQKLCCYPENKGFVKAMAELIQPQIDASKKQRILFSAMDCRKRSSIKRVIPICSKLMLQRRRSSINWALMVSIGG